MLMNCLSAWRAGLFSAAMMMIACPATAGRLEDGTSAYDRGDFAAALSLWEPLANSGDVEAQDRIAGLYASGQGVAEDQTKAAYWFTKSAEGGNADAQWHLAMFYIRGDNPIPRNIPLGLEWLKKAADQDFTPAEYALASVFGVYPELPFNPEQALFWYRKAADQGMKEAMYQVGRAYGDGRGVPRDYVQAAFWFRKAAEKGYQGGELAIGRLLAQGLGVTKDKDQALFWLRKASSEGGAPARVADQLIAGLKADQGQDAWLENLREEAGRGVAAGQVSLGNYYAVRGFGGSTEDASQAMRWWLSAAEQGNLGAMNNLVSAYLLGRFVPRDAERAAFWARKAADMDDPVAELQLGRDYAYGIGVAIDRNQALVWFRKAEAHGGLFRGWAETAIADVQTSGR